mmetsp:Transcript_37276/g.71454  ORF Transcript_37276/g.71454 Transcript_37276/m.71454 type:complete len:325 (+) Transcript_37276:100-1074(+)
MVMGWLRLRGGGSNGQELVLRSSNGPIVAVLGLVGRGLMGIVKVGGICYMGLLAAAFTFQRKILYFPDKSKIPAIRDLPAKYQLIEEFQVSPSSKVTVNGWYWPPLSPDSEQRHKCSLLYFHGNAGSRYNRLGLMNFLRSSLGVGICMIDYRGYGGSTGSPSERGLIEDGKAAMLWLRNRLPEDHQIVLHLESIGSGVGAALVGEAIVGKLPKPRAVIVEGGFSSIADVAASQMPFLFPRLLLKDRYNNISRVRGLSVEDNIPFIFLHGEADCIVPIELARKLYNVLPEGENEFVSWPNADHNELPNFPGYAQRIDDFLQRLGY